MRSPPRSTGETGRLRSPWVAWGAKFAVLLSLCLAPWPGWGEACAAAYCDVANAVAWVAPAGSVRAVFRPTRGDHVLVYQTASGNPRLIPALEALPKQRFVLYGLGRAELRGNVELRTFDERRFVQDLAGARAVIANGEFTTLSEAIYLGKPVLSVPLRHQTEQELNAAYVDFLGLGASTDRIEPAVIARFLDRESSFVKPRDPRIRRGTADARDALDRALAEAA